MSRDSKRVQIAVMDIFTVDNGRLVEHWGVGDFFDLRHQLGTIPTPG